MGVPTKRERRDVQPDCIGIKRVLYLLEKYILFLATVMITLLASSYYFKTDPVWVQLVWGSVATAAHFVAIVATSHILQKNYDSLMAKPKAIGGHQEEELEIPEKYRRQLRPSPIRLKVELDAKGALGGLVGLQSELNALDQATYSLKKRQGMLRDATGFKQKGKMAGAAEKLAAEVSGGDLVREGDHFMASTDSILGIVGVGPFGKYMGFDIQALKEHPAFVKAQYMLRKAEELSRKVRVRRDAVEHLAEQRTKIKASIMAQAGAALTVPQATFKPYDH